jgi:protein involved in polysaccharide export with SLBB domain
MSATTRLTSVRLGRSVSLCLEFAALLLCGLSCGCAAITNPVATGLPVDLVPRELFRESIDDTQTIPLTLLRQPPPDVYRLAPGDILGVWIETILGEKNQAPPVNASETTRQPPSIGFPFPVRENGTLALPLVDPVPVQGLSIDEAEKAIRDAYTVKKQILRSGQERIIVTLVRPRQYYVQVIRQDSGGLTFGSDSVLGNTKRGTGHFLSLPAYENDVLNALARTGGLPGLDAVNEVVIQRGYFRQNSDLTTPPEHEQLPVPRVRPHAPHETRAKDCSLVPAAGQGGQIIRIPLRLHPGEEVPFKPEDVILHTGDIIFIEAREIEFFYTGGLLPPGEHVLPRDHDLDVVQAVAQVHGPFVNGGLNVNNLSGSLITPGIGSPSPSLLIVLRQLPGGGQVPIKIDFGRALRDPRERIILQPRDVLVLQETPGEAFGRYVSEVLKLNFLATLIRQRDLTATGTVVVP